MVDERSGNGHPLLFSPGELRGHRFGPVPDVKRLKQLNSALSGDNVSLTGKHRQQCHIVDHIKKGNEIGGLKDKPYVIAA